MHATPRIVKEIKSANMKFKAVILERGDGRLQIELFRWDEEPLESQESRSGWSLLNDQVLADSVEQAEQIAFERLRAWSGRSG
jgi:hypothetical protein